jgi:cold shock protein
MPTETFFGTVKAVILDRGFGFIERQTGRDVFFHCKDVDPRLHFDETLKYQRVLFSVIETQKGLKAVDVRPAD